MTYRLRPESTADFAAVAGLLTEAFGSASEAEMVTRIRASEQYVLDLSLVASDNGRVVGHVMINGATIRHDSGERPVVMLTPLAVHPEYRRRGIGGSLVDAVTALADERGEPLVVLEGRPRYYSRLGFEFAPMYGIHIDLPDWAPVEAARVKLLSSYDANDPTLRGQVIYPPTIHGVSAD